MSQNLHDLKTQMEQLNASRKELVKLLQQGAGLLAESGMPPAEELISKTERFCSGCAEVRQLIFLDGEESEECTLTQLERGIEEAEAQLKISFILDKVNAIEHADDLDFAPLKKCRFETEKLRDEINLCDNLQEHINAQKLLSGEHGLRALVELVAEAENLDDERWSYLQDQLTSAMPTLLGDVKLGRQLTTAVARGRLRLNASQLKETPELPKRKISLQQDQSASSAAKKPSSSIAEKIAAKRLDNTQTTEKKSPVGETAAKSEKTEESLSVFDSDVGLEQQQHPGEGIILRGGNKQSTKAIEPDKDKVEQTSEVAAAEEAEEREATQPADKAKADLSEPTDFASLSERFGLPMNGGYKPTESAIQSSAAFADQAAAPSDSDITRLVLNLETPVEEIVQAALYSSGQQRDECIAHLIWRMLAEEHFTIAYHLACCLEKRLKCDVQFIPSSLVQAIALGQHVRHPVGEAAKKLTEDFSSFTSDMTNEELSEENLAIYFLLQSSALRAALIAPATGASHVLRNLPMIEGGSEMHNYAVRIARFSEQGDSLDPNVFKRATNEMEWLEETEQLQHEVESWQSQSQERSIRYTPATQIFLHSHWSLTPSKAKESPDVIANWKIWNQAILTVDQVLRPVSDNDFEQVRWVRERADLLSSMVPTEEEEHDGDQQQNGSAPPILPLEEMRTHVREGVGFARRWLALHDSRPGLSDWAIPRPAIELSEEVFSRHDSVLEQLKRYEESFSSNKVRIAINCCRRTMELIKELFDSAIPYSAAILQPRHLIHAELLKNPTVPLNESWEPDVSIGVLETDLLDLIMIGNISWLEAFEARSSYRDHEATERILELDVWDSETERHKYYEKREERISQCRTALQRDIVETQARVQHATDVGLLGEYDREQYSTQLEHLKGLCHKTIDFAGCYAQLRDVCDAMERRRQAEIDRVSKRFDQLKLTEGNLEYRQISAALDKGNITAASQFIDDIETSRNKSGVDWVR